jgi:hypothetical protein
MTQPSSPEPDRPDRRKWSGPAAPDGISPACLDDETLGALADGTIDATSRVAAVAHLVECARCRSAVASVARALADPDVSREVQGLTPRRRKPRWLAWSGLAAAAAVLLVVMVPRESDRESGLHRAPAGQSGEVPSALVPAGVVGAVEELRWSPVVGATRYRVTLFDPNGKVLFEAVPTEPSVALPDSVTLSSGIQYLWKVEAQLGPGRAVSSELVSFTLKGTRP